MNRHSLLKKRFIPHRGLPHDVISAAQLPSGLLQVFYLGFREPFTTFGSYRAGTPTRGHPGKTSSVRSPKLRWSLHDGRVAPEMTGRRFWRRSGPFRLRLCLPSFMR